MPADHDQGGLPPQPDHTKTAIMRAHKTGDPALIASAESDHAASMINSSITKALARTGQPLKRQHAEALAARLRAASR